LDHTLTLTQQQARDAGLDLANSAGIAVVGSNGPYGCPWTKAMLKVENEGLAHVWFSTNTSSRRVAQLRADPRSSVYFFDPATFRGLLLVGEMEVRQDADSRRRLWSDGCERYYPLGVDDPDYTVLRFTARWGNYYHGLSNTSFSL
jgi:general stress protein 26